MKAPLYFENPSKSTKKLTPQQWDQQNTKLGYNPVPNEKTGGYKHYYNPNDYVMDEKGGFVKKSDAGNPNVNYNNDPSYQPLIKYQDPVENITPKKLGVEADSGRKAFDFQYANQGYTGYKYNNGDIKYLNDKGEDLQNLNKQPGQVAQMKSGGLVKKVKGYVGGGGISDEDEGSIINGVSAIGGAVGQGIQMNNTNADGTIDPNKAGLASGLKDASGGAALGAQIGSVIPGVGTLIGGGIGLLGGGLYGALTGNKQARDQNSVIQKQLADKAKAKEDVQRQFNFNNNLSTAFADRQAGYKDGGKIEGSGTAKSDSIKAKVEKGSFVVPAENAQAAEEIRKKVLKAPSMKRANLNQKEGEEVKLSDGEHLFTPEEKEKITSLLGHEILEALAPNAEHGEDEMKNGGLTSGKAKIILKDGSVRGHALSDKQKKFFGFIAGGGKVNGYEEGGDIEGESENVIPPTNERAGKMVLLKKQQDLQRRDKLLALKDQLSKSLSNPNDPNKYYNQTALKNTTDQINQLNKTYGEPKSSDNNGIGINYLAGDKTENTDQNTAKIKAPKIGNITAKSTTEVNNSPFSKDYAAEENPNIAPPQTPAAAKTTSQEEPTILGSKNWSTYDDLNGTGAQPSSGISDTGSALSKGLGAVLNYGLPLVQAAMGANYLKKAGARPVDQIDPDYLNGISKSQGIVERANNAAKYGYTPEEQAAIDSQNNNATEAQRFAARDLSGGSAANAYTMERNALNDSYGRGLQAKLGGRQLQLQKQSYADSKQSELNNLLQDKANRSRMLFGDTMNAFQQNQQAGSNLVGAGLSNLIGANRYQQELGASQKRNQMYNPQYPS